MPTKLGEAEFVPHLEWRDAEARLGLMEEQSRRALQNRWKMAAINVVQPADWESPLVLPDHQAEFAARVGLLGPDGKALS